MKTIAETLDNLHKTLSDGYKKSDGEMIIPSRLSLNGQVATLPATPSTPPNPLLLGETPLRESVAHQNQLTMLLQQTYACQKTYADKAEMMEYRDGMFQEILKDYALFEIKKAFIEHVRTSPDLPTPSDIIKLIERYRPIPAHMGR